MKTKLLLTGLALIAFTAFANAQNPVVGQGQGRGPCNGTGRGAAFVDANNDGICDNQGTRGAGISGNKGAGNGKCNGKGQGQGKGKGKNFVDANGNGVCDTFEARAKK